MSSFSIVHVKCATFCEFFTLSLADLFRFLWKFPKKTQIMREAVSERIAFARKMKNIATTEMKLKQIHSIFVSLLGLNKFSSWECNELVLVNLE